MAIIRDLADRFLRYPLILLQGLFLYYLITLFLHTMSFERHLKCIVIGGVSGIIWFIAHVTSSSEEYKGILDFLKNETFDSLRYFVIPYCIASYTMTIEIHNFNFVVSRDWRYLTIAILSSTVYMILLLVIKILVNVTNKR